MYQTQLITEGSRLDLEVGPEVGEYYYCRYRVSEPGFETARAWTYREHLTEAEALQLAVSCLDGYLDDRAAQVLGRPF